MAVMTRTMSIAIWFGLLTGLIEGGGYLLLQAAGWASASMWRLPASAEIVWIATVVDVLVYTLVGLGLLVAGRFLPVLKTDRAAVFVFSAMTFVILLQFPGKLHLGAVALLALGIGTTLSRLVGRREPAARRALRRTLPWVVGLATLAAASTQGGLWVREWTLTRNLPAADAGTPNILVVVVDTLRADHLSAYGYPRETSPNLDRLIGESVWFENGIATSSWTLPSHASLLTGADPHHHGAETLALDDRLPTIGEVLQRRGYRTAAFSANQYWFGRREGFGRGFIRFGDYFHDAHSRAVRPFFGRVVDHALRVVTGSADLPARKTAPDVNAEALEWIDDDRRRPFFVVLNYFDVHKPYLPPEPFLTRFAESKERFDATPMFDGADFPSMTADQRQRDLDAYDGAIRFVDDAFGRLLAELETRDLRTNTVVVVTSDHGESFAEHGIYTHRAALYLQEIRVPLVFSWPDRLPAVRLLQPVSIAAVPATLLEILGASAAHVFPRPSIARFWMGGAVPTDDDLPIAELAHQPDEPFAGHPVVHGAMRSVVTERWQYIVHDKFGPELYDLAQDPKELTNLAGTPEGRRIVGELAAVLDARRSKATAASKPGG
jgi:arylsulfatase A-like enzyme